VFPGGRLDPEDYPGGAVPNTPTDADLESAARTAAQREAMEEAGVVVEPATLRRWSHWTPPPTPVAKGLNTHRFTTAFFVGVAIGDTDAIRVDDGEIRDHTWTTPAEMLERQAGGDVTLAPPTFITLSQLLGPRNPPEVLLAAPKAPSEVEHFATRVGEVDGGWVALYHGDVAYEGGAVEEAGGRHRLTMGERWEYIRDAG
jgi:8-oxo-dGTP pyrophosphatase MutT (NUDIX family)